MADDFAVRLSAGSLRHGDPFFVVPHAWSDAGVAVEGGGTGAHLLHASIALCVLNDVFREADADGLAVAGVAVRARGGFTAEWFSTGISYDVEVAGLDDDAALAGLLARVDTVAEVPRAVRVGPTVVRTGG
jgi:hypothetical protein